ncbi:cation:proton antiporter domain-containing protein [Marinoscillum pacificum]|uniref:cation:proton antiporter domain-containing protein n=1 Tax=Marinoscillum pacificum TaxID=392723 RepID=UPI002157502D|nr:cation:proton antiporter [Marinoscillum pacificum]
MNILIGHTVHLSIQIDPVLSILVVLSIGIVLISIIFKLLRQPYVIAYILVGILMGPHGFRFVIDEVLISDMGSFGLVLLLFFVGMEISLPKLLANWRISLIGTIVQIMVSVGVVGLVGYYLNWPINRIVVIGFVISLSSSAIVFNYLENQNLIHSKVGQNVIGILLIQDILVVPMLIIINYVSGARPDTLEMIKQIIGGCLILGITLWVLTKKRFICHLQNVFGKITKYKFSSPLPSVLVFLCLLLS